MKLERGQRRDYARNMATRVAMVAPSLDNPGTFESLFTEHYQAIRNTVEGFDRPGVAVIAIDFTDSRLGGTMCIAAKSGTANIGIVGRHGMCDLFLDDDPALSLRHIAVIVDPPSSWTDAAHGDLRFRVLDLRTSGAFEDETGRKLEALVAEGPLFIRCARFALFHFPTGEGIDWPDTPEQAWELLPERVYIREADAEPDRWARKRPAKANKLQRSKRERKLAGDYDGRAVTSIQVVRGPSRARRHLVAPGETPLGSLLICTDDLAQSYLVGEQALNEGILLGRYDRCDGAGSEILSDGNLSRVHLLVLRIGEQVYAADTGSTNGSWIIERGDEKEIKMVPLDSTTEITLGTECAFVRWRPYSA